MRIAVMAAGAVGGYFGARLAMAGHEVHFIARGTHLDAIRKDGLRIASTHGDLHLKDVKATPRPEDVGPVDIVLFAVKLWDTETAAGQARSLVGPQTRVITLQNGVDSVERMAPILGADCVVGGIAQIASVIEKPGVISHTSPFATMRIGRVDGRPDAALAAFTDAAKAAGLDITLSDAINRDRWLKFIFLVGLSGITSATRSPLGPIMADPDTRAFLHRLMQETMLVGRAQGVPLEDGYVADRMDFAAKAPPTMKASMCHDLERGNRLELDWLAGKVVQLGRESGVAVPANEAVYALLKLHRAGRSG
ncbi:MAG: 2-dehydropantoate 2-reductase [Pseudorhodoplanes sp.]|nr:putative 2-dehydropantoate 2-reductase [Pseudorhodoplanes sp.]MBW7950321.1 2-dehydropantoate 2-reductase [Pseudorhodoplanes sp.]MCL4712658.1 2-dehydropantoate 2-reductase [Pseudorhodoplanes sp.]MCQ3941707.1 2-dehydropantoate 2-reductase [Alphaproteobacteria bacterium]GIK81456.1 MAG: 2-dehydropantoate 2-reductase [Alphaproteobacteria bacterium]